MIVRWTLLLADGRTVIGSIQGAGGRLGPNQIRLNRAIRLAGEGMDHGLACPDYPDRTTGRAYLYPREDGPPERIQLAGAQVLRMQITDDEGADASK